MPSAPDELQDLATVLFGSIDTVGPISFLQSRGYTLTKGGEWLGPTPDHKPTWKEEIALDFLFMEWDFGGVVRAGSGPTPDLLAALEAAEKALGLAENVLSRAPNSTRMWSIGEDSVHPQIGIEIIRSAQAAIAQARTGGALPKKATAEMVAVGVRVLMQELTNVPFSYNRAFERALNAALAASVPSTPEGK